MATDNPPSELHRRHLFAFIFSLVMFFSALFAVFYGFIGYYSRVSLISEFQQQGANIDFVFMRAEQVSRDEESLQKARDSLRSTEQNISAQLIGTIASGHTSDEYKNYLTAASAAEGVLINSIPLLSNEYLVKIKKIDYEKPDLRQAELFGSPEFKPDTPPELQAELYRKLTPAVQDLRIKIVLFNAGYGNHINLIASVNKATTGGLRMAIRDILARNPQWATQDEVESYDIETSSRLLEKDLQLIAQQRAVIGSYRRALGWASAILQWPTIVSTMLVTLAAGWLGGLVSVMGAAIRASRPESEWMAELHAEPNVTLIRRSILGITAALGIFLFAGAGLLALTPQSGRFATSGSIELSPYIVAFLAFISGFLADDAFLRLTSTGRALLQPGGRGKPTNPKDTGRARDLADKER
jgi:hypothetical protein